MASGFHHNALVEKRGKIMGERGGAANIGDSHLRTLAPEKERSGQAGLAESDDEYLFAF